MKISCSGSIYNINDDCVSSDVRISPRDSFIKPRYVQMETTGATLALASSGATSSAVDTEVRLIRGDTQQSKVARAKARQASKQNAMRRALALDNARRLQQGLTPLPLPSVQPVSRQPSRTSVALSFSSLDGAGDDVSAISGISVCDVVCGETTSRVTSHRKKYTNVNDSDVTIERVECLMNDKVSKDDAENLLERSSRRWKQRVAGVPADGSSKEISSRRSSVGSGNNNVRSANGSYRSEGAVPVPSSAEYSCLSGLANTLSLSQPQRDVSHHDDGHNAKDSMLHNKLDVAPRDAAGIDSLAMGSDERMLPLDRSEMKSPSVEHDTAGNPLRRLSPAAGTDAVHRLGKMEFPLGNELQHPVARLGSSELHHPVARLGSSELHHPVARLGSSELNPRRLGSLMTHAHSTMPTVAEESTTFISALVEPTPYVLEKMNERRQTFGLGSLAMGASSSVESRGKVYNYYSSLL